MVRHISRKAHIFYLRASEDSRIWIMLVSLSPLLYGPCHLRKLQPETESQLTSPAPKPLPLVFHFSRLIFYLAAYHEPVFA